MKMMMTTTTYFYAVAAQCCSLFYVAVHKADRHAQKVVLKVAELPISSRSHCAVAITAIA